jgi:hypothetical protein
MATPSSTTPQRVLAVARIGGGLSLVAAAMISFEGLNGLGALIGIHPSWLLPLAIDIYAVTCAVVALNLPAGHAVRGSAVGNAALGLLMSMGGNSTYRGMTHGWSGHNIILMVADACPSLIVERLIHLVGVLARGAATTETRDEAEAAAPAPVQARRAQHTPVATAPRHAANAQPLPGPAPQPTATATTAPPTATEPAPTAPPPTPTTAPATTTAPTAPGRTTLSTPTARQQKIRNLILERGRENVDGAMVGEALGVHRSNGRLALKKFLEDLDAGLVSLNASSSLSSSPAVVPAATP